MSSQFVVSFAAAAMASVPAHAAVSETGLKVAGIAISTLSDDLPAQLKIYDAKGGFHRAIQPFGEFRGGVRVAAGDINGDGVADLVTGFKGASQVNVFNGRTLERHLTFDAYDAAFKGGVFVAAGDVNGDGFADIVTGAGPGGGPHVRAFDGRAQPLKSFNAFDPAFAGGVSVAAGDVNGDGVADIVTGAGPGGGPHVRVFDGASLKILHDFDAFSPDFNGGVSVATGKFQGDQSLFVSAAFGDGSVRVFSLADMSLKASFFAFDPGFKGGVSLGFTSDGVTDTLVVGQASDGGLVGLFDVSKPVRTDLADGVDAAGDAIYFSPFGADYRGGVSVAGLGAVAPVPEPATWTFMIAGFAASGFAMRRQLRGEAASSNATA